MPRSPPRNSSKRSKPLARRERREFDERRHDGNEGDAALFEPRDGEVPMTAKKARYALKHIGGTNRRIIVAIVAIGVTHGSSAPKTDA